VRFLGGGLSRVVLSFLCCYLATSVLDGDRLGLGREVTLLYEGGVAVCA